MLLATVLLAGPMRCRSTIAFIVRALPVIGLMGVPAIYGATALYGTWVRDAGFEAFFALAGLVTWGIATIVFNTAETVSPWVVLVPISIFVLLLADALAMTLHD